MRNVLTILVATGLVVGFAGCTSPNAEPASAKRSTPASNPFLDEEVNNAPQQARLVFFNKTIYFGNDPTGAPQRFVAPLDAGFDNVTATLSWHYTGVSASNNLYLRVYDPNGEMIYGNGFGISALATGSPHSRTTPAVPGDYRIEGEGWGTHSVSIHLEAVQNAD